MGKIKNMIRMLSIKNFIFLTLAGIISAIGVVIFLQPVKLYDSGISGTSMLVAQLTPDWCSLSLILLVLNIPIFLFGLKREGAVFTIYATYAVMIYSLSAWLIEDVLPIDVSSVSPLAGDDLFLCAVFGGFICGSGSGLSVRFGGAIDGIEIFAIMFAKKLGLSLGSFIMVYNLILYIICGIVLNSWALPLYSIVTYLVASKVIDFIVEGVDRSKAAFIITSKPKEVCQALSETFENGITTIEARGYYSNTEKTVVYFIVNQFQVTKMRNLVHSTDPYAYIAINEVADIFPATNLDDRNKEATTDESLN